MSTSTKVFRIVSDATRCGDRRGELEPDRSADVVDDEVEPVEPERVDRGEGEPAEAGPAVVEVRRPLGEAESGQVERDAPKSAGSELGDKFAVQE